MYQHREQNIRIRVESIAYSREKAREERKAGELLSTRLDKLKELSGEKADTGILEEYKIVKWELSFIYYDKIRGIILRAKCQWVDGNEKSSKFFLSLEKRNYNLKHIKRSINF